MIRTEIDVASFRLSVSGRVDKPLSLTLKDIVDGMPRVERAAVNQCSGNSRGFSQPVIPGAMGHSAGMVLTQPNLAKATWAADVATTIVDYLAATKGAE